MRTILTISFLIVYGCCYAQHYTLNADFQRHLYIYDADNGTTKYIDTTDHGNLVGLELLNGAFKAFFENNGVISAYTYTRPGQEIQARSFFKYVKQEGTINQYMLNDSTCFLAASSTKGTFDLYLKDKKVYSYSPQWKGMSSAHIGVVPADADIPAQTLLIQEAISPTSVLANPRTDVKELDFGKGTVRSLFKNSERPCYSPDKEYILYYAFSVENSANKAVFYYNRKTKKTTTDYHCIISFWL